MERESQAKKQKTKDVKESKNKGPTTYTIAQQPKWSVNHKQRSKKTKKHKNEVPYGQRRHKTRKKGQTVQRQLFLKVKKVRMKSSGTSTVAQRTA